MPGKITPHVQTFLTKRLEKQSTQWGVLSTAVFLNIETCGKTGDWCWNWCLCCKTSHSLVIFKMLSSIFMSRSISFLGFSYAVMHSPLFLSIGCFPLFPGATSQDLQQRQHLAVRASTTLSQGSREWTHRGRKSHERSAGGRDAGFLCCRMLITMMAISRMSRGTTTPTSTGQPASDRLKMKSGSMKKQPRM